MILKLDIAWLFHNQGLYREYRVIGYVKTEFEKIIVAEA